MRRVLRWTLPLSVAVAAAILFGSGFWLALRGGAGEPVTRAAAPAMDQAPPPVVVSGRVLVLGDSLARGTGDSTGKGIAGNLVDLLAAETGKVPEVINLAVNGARTRDLARSVERENVQRIAESSEMIIVSIGGNDLFGISIGPEGTPADPEADARELFRPVLERVKAIVHGLREANPEARIYLIGLYDPFRERGRSVAPYVAIWNASLAEAFSEDPGVIVVQTSDLFASRDRLSADRFHPGDEAYRLIARRIVDTL